MTAVLHRVKTLRVERWRRKGYYTFVRRYPGGPILFAPHDFSLVSAIPSAPREHTGEVRGSLKVFT